MTATLIKNWSSTAGSNNSASPNGAPEGMAPSGVNDTIRQNMASIRDWYIDPCWIDLGYTYAYVATTQFKIAGLDKTADFVVGRRVRAVGVTTGTIYGTISVSAFSTDTTVTVVWDSGTLTNETLAVSIGLPALGKPVPYSSLGLTGKIVLADMADLAQDLFIIRTTASTGVPQTATCTAAARTVLDDTTVAAMRTTLGAAAITTNTFTGAQIGAVTALTSSGGHIATDLSVNNNFSHTFTEVTVLDNPTNVVAGQSGRIFFTQHASSPKTMTFGTYWIFPALENGGSDPAMTATNSAIDVLYYDVLSTTQISCHLSKGLA